MREGKFLTEAPPAQILRQTGAPDLETAFLRLATGSSEISARQEAGKR